MTVGQIERWKVGMGLAALAACSQSNVPSFHPSTILTPDNRVVISDFSQIDAVAASSWFIYAATPRGLLIYDRVARRFRPPVTRLDGFPEGRVRRAAADPSGNAVWLDLGSALGYARYDVDGRAWTRGFLPSRQFDGILTVDAALAGAPIADAMRAAILSDQRLRTHQFTSAATTPDRPEIYFGTNGMGMVRVDKQTGEWDVLSYGLVAPGVGAVAIGSGGVWAAANARASERRGISWVDNDVSVTRAIEGYGAALGFNFLSSRRLLSAGGHLWLATEQGVLRIDPATFRSRVFDLPQATSLARAPDGVWVGTRRGLFIITADDRVTAFGSSAAGGLAITSLVAVRDTLWVGTTAGLGRVVPGSEAIVPVVDRVTVYALARLQDTLLMATDRELRWRGQDSPEWRSLPIPLNLGTPTSLSAATEKGVWIGGTQGLAFADIQRSFIHVHTVPLEIPGAVRDIAIDRDYLWAATDSGLVRIQ
jgi:hypothetical protein